MIRLPDFYHEPIEFRGKWQTQCQVCDWVSDTVALYPDECEIYACPECDSTDIVDVNLDDEL